MTSPRLSTDGTISAIERALATWEAEVATTTKALGYDDAYNHRCKAELAAARAELAELRAQPEQGREVERRVKAPCPVCRGRGEYDIEPGLGGSETCRYCHGLKYVMTTVRELAPRR